MTVERIYMEEQKVENLFEKIVALSKRRGFVYPGSEIYGGLANTYDYGPMGTELLRNIKNAWWSHFIHGRRDMVGIDASIISSHKIWDASGHTASFADALVDCKNCKFRTRADHLIEDYLETIPDEKLSSIGEDIRIGFESLNVDFEKIKNAIQTRKVEGLSTSELTHMINFFSINCPKCGPKHDWTEVRKFNQLFPVKLGIVEGDDSLAYLRGETAQGIFINFKNVMDTNRVKIPFGIGQIGKSFRNEITMGNFVFRTIEFEQGEIEFFFDPAVTEWEPLFENWKKEMWNFVTKELGVNAENLRWRVHTDEERSFYSKKTEDLDYKYPFGFKELWGIAYRTDYDLKAHMEHSGKDLQVVDSSNGRKFIPHVIEPAVGINRLFLMVLFDAYREEGERVWLSLHPKIAPFKAAVFPLLGNKPELTEKAEKLFDDLKKQFNVTWDDRGNIGKRYAAQDEIGTPFCITVDFQSLEDETVTIRDRDLGTQERLAISKLAQFITEKIN